MMDVITTVLFVALAICLIGDFWYALKRDTNVQLIYSTLTILVAFTLVIRAFMEMSAG